MQNEAQYGLDRREVKISALYSDNLDKYEYLTDEDLGLKPSTTEQAKFEYSPLGKVFTKGLDKDDQKDELFKRLKNIEKNQNSNNNDKSKLSSARSESSFYFSPPSSARSESSKKTSIIDDQLERSVYLPDVDNMKGINTSEQKNETQTSFEHLKNNIDEFLLGYPDIFDSDLKNFFRDIASEEKGNIDYKLLSKQILIRSRKTFSFLQKHGDLYNFWINMLNHKSSDKVKLQ